MSLTSVSACVLLPAKTMSQCVRAAASEDNEFVLVSRSSSSACLFVPHLPHVYSFFIVGPKNGNFKIAKVKSSHRAFIFFGCLNNQIVEKSHEMLTNMVGYSFSLVLSSFPRFCIHQHNIISQLYYVHKHSHVSYIWKHDACEVPGAHSPELNTVSSYAQYERFLFFFSL